MKLNVKLLAALFAVATLATTSCKDDTPEPLSRKDAETAMQTMSADMTTAMGAVMQTPAGVAISNLSVLMGSDDQAPIGAAKSATKILTNFISKEKIKQLAKGNVEAFIKSLSEEEEEEHPFYANVGTYTWNSTQLKWDTLHQPADKIIFIFPSTGRTGENDANLTISDYTELTSNYDFFPTSLKGKLTIGTQTAFTLDYSASATATQFNSASISVTLADFSASAEIGLTASGSSLIAKVKHNIKKANVTLTSSSLEVTIPGKTAISPFDVDNEEEVIPSLVKGFAQMGGVKVEVNLTPAKLLATKPTSTSQAETLFNENMKATFYSYPEGAKIGTLVWKFVVEEGGITPFLKYNDGTEVLLVVALGFEEGFDFDF